MDDYGDCLHTKTTVDHLLAFLLNTMQETKKKEREREKDTLHVVSHTHTHSPALGYSPSLLLLSLCCTGSRFCVFVSVCTVHVVRGMFAENFNGKPTV